MNKNQIIQALENASDKQLEQIAAIVNTEPVQATHLLDQLGGTQWLCS